MTRATSSHSGRGRSVHAVHAGRAGVLCALCATMLLALVAAPSAQQADRPAPHWVEQMADEQMPQWDGWQNALRPSGEQAAPLTLATDGATEYVIVIPEDATGLEKRAADEVALWLGEITGAEFPIVSDSEPAQDREISVGLTNRLEAADAPEFDEPGREGYAIAVADERLYLVGGEQRGPLPAVFALLEEDLGVRWYTPSLTNGSWDALTDALKANPWPSGAVRVPDRPTLEVSIVPRTSNPAIPVRQLNWRRGYNPWGQRNRVNGGYAHFFGQHGYVDGSLSVHTFHRLVPPDEYFENHPEYFSLINGERRHKRGQLCLSNPDVAAAAAKTISDRFGRVPESQHTRRDRVAVSQMDWKGDCQCENCQAIVERLGTYGGLQLDFVNRTADLIREDYPWATLTTLAYRQSKEPPTGDIKARDNVAVRFCTDFGASFNWPYHSFYDDRIAEQRRMFERWHEVSDRMHLWIYPHQYRHRLAPMPNIRAVAENIRYFTEQNAETVYVQQSIGMDLGREPMRFWIWSKLQWDPTRDVEELMLDFIFGYFGEAAPAVVEYEQLLLEHCVTYTDFTKKRNWIYAIHDEEMYRHGFVDEARAILARAAQAAESDAVRERVRRLKAGVVYIEALQLFMQMRDGDTPPDADRYSRVRRELASMCGSLDIDSVGFYDGTRSINPAEEFLDEMRTVRERRVGKQHLDQGAFGQWTFRRDPDDIGVAEGWYAVDAGGGDEWTPVEVPAFLQDTAVGDVEGFGWYRTTFDLPGEQADHPVELHFGAVDEQAWVYLNGEQVGEHSLDSEFTVGEEITVGDLWNRPFTIEVAPEHLNAGSNVLAVRIHNSKGAAGIHQPVRVFLSENAD